MVIALVRSTFLRNNNTYNNTVHQGVHDDAAGTNGHDSVDQSKNPSFGGRLENFCTERTTHVSTVTLI